MIADMKARADKTAADVAADIERIRTQGKAATDTAQPVDPIDDLLSRLRSSFPGAQIIRG
jgi:membrane protein involved in colicin uptake